MGACGINARAKISAIPPCSPQHEGGALGSPLSAQTPGTSPLGDGNRCPDLDTAEGIAFLQTCSRCHTAPDPKQHTSAEWPGVVQRMMQNMKTMRKVVPDQKQVDMVTAFLQRHAK